MSSGTDATTTKTAALLLADGKVFYGDGIGAEGTSCGEICFNTAMTGYQEVLTDPSYTGQVITFTFPHIGNVGTNDEDIEAQKPCAAGLVVREPVTDPSNFRSTKHFTAWLKANGITGISGIDTRALTRHIRRKGAQNVAIIYSDDGKLDLESARQQLEALPAMKGLELASHVTTPNQYEWLQTEWELGKGYAELANPKWHVVAIDYGEKLNILRCLAERGCKVTVVGANTAAEDILALKPDGIFLSNGPGDPFATSEAYAKPILQKLVASGTPIFGICLGHQLLSIALGAETEKMHQGHRGANHPVKNLLSGTVEITSQNHGFVVTPSSIPDEVEITHQSLFDGTVEGIQVKGKPIFSVQHHPESSPGPHDSRYLFDRFVEEMKAHA